MRHSGENAARYGGWSSRGASSWTRHERSSLNQERAGAEQIRELAALIGREQRVDAPERRDDHAAEPLLALHALAGDRVDLRRVERLLGHRVRERGGRAALIDGDLRALRLQIAEHLRELIDLLFRQIE